MQKIYLILLLWSFGNMYAQCPASFECDNGEITLFFENFSPDALTFYFSLNDPHNGNTGFTELINGTTHHIELNENWGNCSNISFENMLLIVDGNQVCNYVNGVLCNDCPIAQNDQSPHQDCEPWVNQCESDLLDWAEDAVENINCEQWDGRCRTDSPIFRYGRVSVGTAAVAPSPYFLAVKDGIIAKAIDVENCSEVGWCDYVFDEGYRLMPLNELKKFIDTNNHLPDFPSSAEVEDEKGFELKAMTRMQQVKIEEIYLHLIALNRELKTLQARYLDLKD